MQKEIKREYGLNGTLSREYQVNSKGQVDGWYKSYWSNEQLSVECTYKNGILDGIYKFWFTNGQIYFMEQNKNNNLHGIEILFK
jgi:antitoxin component YwqK of YwqJK toxin-antitoxin module